MIPQAQAEHLRHALAAGRVCLFLGAGFSASCKNELGSNLPVGDALAQHLWNWLGYSQAYDYSPLSEVYEAALSSGRKRDELHALLKRHLLATEIPVWYDSLAQFYWHRIYSTNADDVIESIYARAHSAPNLLTKIEHVDDYEDRDPSLRTIQLIKLNGDVKHPPDTLTFGIQRYAERTGRDPWYEHFVRDYASVATIFIGSQLREPLFWENLTIRGKRKRGESEHRPRSYLVSRSIPPPKKTILEDLNVVPIECDTQTFLAYLVNDLFGGKPPDRLAVLDRSAPLLAKAERSLDTRIGLRYERVFSCFQTVPTNPPTSPVRGKAFLLGVPPAWEDILRGLDAPRQVNDTLKQLAGRTEPPVILLHGSAGCGKSTILKRTALGLAKEGHFVLFTEGDIVPSTSDLMKYLEDLPDGRRYVFIDNAGLVSGYLRALVRETKRTAEKKRPTLIFAARTNDLDRWRDTLSIDDPVELQVPHLDDTDISALIDLLSTQGLLGKLEGRSRIDQETAFRQVARRQILIAMREATQGRGFDQIIDDEFESLKDSESKTIYLVGALVTAQDFKITRDELVGCSEGPLNTALERIDRNLSGILIPIDSSKGQYVLRHRVIAERILDASAPRMLLRDAYERLIVVLALDMGHNPSRSFRPFRLYRALINHRQIFRRFGQAVAEARAVYDKIRTFVSHDYHYWLQYGLLELAHGELDLAAPYLESAGELGSNDDYVLAALAHLHFRQSLELSNIGAAENLREEAESELRKQIQTRGERDYVVYHLLASQIYAWANRWLRDDPERRYNELRSALDVADDGIRKHRHSSELKQLREDLYRAYLQAAVI